MLRIVRGEESHLLSYFSKLRTEDPDSIVLRQKESFFGFGGIRLLLSQLDAHLGEDLVPNTLEKHRAVASFVDHRLIDQLSPEESRLRRYFSARYSSNLSHNWYLQRPLVDAWAAILRDLFSRRRSTLLIPVLNHLDTQTIATLKALFRLYPEETPLLILGYEAKVEPPKLDAFGIDWSRDQIYIQKFAQGLANRFGVQVLALEDQAPSTAVSDHQYEELFRTPAPIYRCLEKRAMTQFGTSPQPCSPDLIRASIGGIKAAFESCDFHTAIRIGLKLLEGAPDFEPADAADVHGLVAISAHNIDLGRETAGEEIRGFLAQHYQEALTHETRPAERCALCYRLSVTFGRRMKNLDGGMYWANQAIENSRNLGLTETQQTYYECWGRNIRSYVLMLQRQIDAGFEEGDTVFDLLSRAIARLPEKSSEKEAPEIELWRRELLMTQMVMSENMIALGYRSGTMEKYHEWLHEQEALIAEDQYSFGEFNALSWVNFYNSQLQPKLALPWALKGIEAMGRSFTGDLEQDLTLTASMIHYRLGNSTAACGLVNRFLAGAAGLKTVLAESAQELNFLSLLIKAGRLDRAEEIVLRALQETTEPSRAERAELIAARGLIAAHRGNDQEAETQINQAIDLAVESGERNTLLRVALVAAISSRALGRRDDAKNAYAQALELIEANRDSPLDRQDLLEVYLGLHEAHHPGENWAHEALELLPGALESHEAWWNLRRLLIAVRDSLRHDADGLSAPKYQEPLEALLLACSQRDDCSPVYGELVQSFPHLPAAAQRHDEVQQAS